MRILPFLPLVLIAGCFYPHPPPPPSPPELTGTATVAANCAATVFPLNPRIDAWSIDKFVGRYTRGSESLTVARADHRLLVTRPGFGTRELSADNVESRQWHDACGLRYDFTLPADGSGALLRITDTNGTVSDWHR